jgi:hypothetical protein
VENDLRACDRALAFVDAHRAALAPAWVAALAEAMDRLDFAAAAALCRELERGIGVDRSSAGEASTQRG